jgi:hypothetical protein
MEGAPISIGDAAHYEHVVVPQFVSADIVSTPAAVVTSRPQGAAMTTARDALRSPETLRAAFLVREILGPPRALEQL